jgi:malate dehydrogenase (oxaloacetate-decarboxylating)
MNIPVFHDDQHGTAIVVLAALINALKIVNKRKEDIRVVINGAGAAGTAIYKILKNYGVQHFVVLDSRGIIGPERDDVSGYKEMFVSETQLSGDIATALQGSDVFIGLSAPGVVTTEMVASMNTDAIIFAMANPVPEIYPEEAKAGGARIVATGRSDFANQINNVLAFPGVFRGIFDAGGREITEEMKIAAGVAIAAIVGEELHEEYIIPSPFDERVMPAVADAVQKLV